MNPTGFTSPLDKCASSSQGRPSVSDDSGVQRGKGTRGSFSFPSASCFPLKGLANTGKDRGFERVIGSSCFIQHHRLLSTCQANSYLKVWPPGLWAPHFIIEVACLPSNCIGSQGAPTPGGSTECCAREHRKRFTPVGKLETVGANTACMSCAPVPAPMSHWTSQTKHNSKDMITKNFKTTTAEH